MTHDEKMGYHLRCLYRPALQAFAYHGTSVNAFTCWRDSARPALHELIGLNRIRDELGRFTPSVSLGVAADLGGYTRRSGILHAEPQFDVPFWYLKPKGGGPFPIALFPHGHYADHGLDYAAGVATSAEMQKRIEDEDRDVAVQAVRHGFVAIAPATRGFLPACIQDTTHRPDDSNCRSHLLHSLLAGRTVIGERVWDLRRLIDWAITEPDTDGSAVLMMGNSGGGVATLYAAACDERITTAVSSCSFCTYVGENGAIHHCDCNAVPGVLRFGEFHDIAGLIAPRHLLIVHGRTDPLFPPKEVKRALKGLRRLYDAAGAATALKHEYGAGGHRFYRNLMWPFVLDALSHRATEDQSANRRRGQAAGLSRNVHNP